MRSLVLRLLRPAVRWLRSITQDEPFTIQVKTDRYRARGAKIANCVRLVGTIDDLNPELVSIGEYSVIGKDAALLTHCPIKGPKPVSVGRFVYIGYGALIMPGVTIGDHAVIGAGSVVTRSVDQGQIVGGNPARAIRLLTADERGRIECTLRTGETFKINAL